VKNYCPLPFKHVFVEPRGVKPCCSYIFPSQDNIETYLSSPELADLQKTILSDRIHKGCQYCFRKEADNGISTRLSALDDYRHARFDTTEIDYVDYRSSNICNFKCRSCEPFFSNGISQEIKKNPALQKFFNIPVNKTASISDTHKDWVLKNINKIRKLMFTGGEPTKIPEVREIIDHIIGLDNLDINILITSNASFTDPYWTNITRRLQNIHWTLSIDAQGPAAEIIRHGTDWPLVAGNLEMMFDIAPSISVGTLVTNLSLFHLTDLMDLVNSLDERYQHRANGRTHLIEICFFPEHLSPYNLPDALRDIAIDRLSHYLRTKSILKPTQISALTTLIANLKTRKFDSELWRKFQEHNGLLNQVRGEDHSALFPLNS